MATSFAGEASFRVEGSAPASFSSEGSLSHGGSVPRKASIECADPGKASVALAVPGKASVERADRGKASFALEGSVPAKGFVHTVPSKQASVGVKDPSSDFGTGSFSCEGSSVPVPPDGCVLVHGKDDSEKGSGGPICTDKDDSKVSVPVDQGVVVPWLQYPWIIQRFRLRRLLSFLASTRFYDAYVAMQSNVSLVLDHKCLQRYLELCQWEDARNYILAILPYDYMGEDGRTLMDFLTYLMFMHSIATGHQMAPEFIAKFDRSCQDPAVLRDANRATIMRTIVSMRSQQVRSSIDWNVVGKKAAEIVRDFITQAPEFSDYLRLPRCSSDIHNVVNVLPRGFCSRKTRSVKKAARVPGSVIAKYFLQKGRLHPGNQRMGCSGLVTDPSAWLRSAIDEALRTGMRAALYQAYPIGYACNEGMDRKRLWSNVSQNLDAGSYPKRPRKDEI